MRPAWRHGLVWFLYGLLNLLALASVQADRWDWAVVLACVGAVIVFPLYAILPEAPESFDGSFARVPHQPPVHTAAPGPQPTWLRRLMIGLCWISVSSFGWGLQLNLVQHPGQAAPACYALGFGALLLMLSFIPLWRSYSAAPAAEAIPQLSPTGPIATPRSHAADARCPYCHQDLEGETHTCAECGVGYHEECLLEMRGCATLGCANTPPPRQTLPKTLKARA